VVARNIHDTVRDTDATRLKAHLDGPRNDAGAKKVIEYSDGTEITVERSGGGATFSDGRPALKEVRTITRTKTPPTRVGQMPWREGQYEKVFGHD
jgi:hypothetical protein